MKKTIGLAIVLLCLFQMASAQKVIFSDNFNDNHNNWFLDSANGMSFLVYNGKYVIDNNDSGTHASFVPVNIDSNKNYSINLTVTHTAGSIGYGFGLYFGGLDINNFYYLDISCNGYFSFGKYANGSHTAIISWTASPLVKKGEYESNKLGVVKDGTYWKLMINDQVATTVPIGPFMGNKVGFTQSVKQRIEYDDLTVKQ
jgi:hypothetical protein